MKKESRVCGVILVRLCVSACATAPSPAAPEAAARAKPSVCFSPGGRCNLRVAKAFDQAQRSIDVAVYFFTDPSGRPPQLPL